MKKIKRIAVCALLIALLHPSFAQEGGTVLEVRGTVETRAGDSADWKAAAPGDLIGGNTVISTGFKSTARISLGASTLSVRPLTRLTLEELVRRDTEEEVRLGLQTGRIRAEVKPPSGSKTTFTVRAPAATASVRGTSFEFDGRRLWVEDGRVLLESSSGQSGYIDGGQRSYVDGNDQNRLVPPFEAEAALLTPRLPEVDRTGGSTREPPVTSAGSPGDVSVDTEWP